MHIFGDRKWIEIDGEKTHELPPLLVRTDPSLERLDNVVALAQTLVENEDLVPGFAMDEAQELDLERRRLDMAIQLVEQYAGLVQQWQWGDAVIEWIRQCETAFGMRMELRSLLRPDVWPHAGRTSFVTLLADKHVETGGVDLEKAVGLRLAFRQPIPITCCSDQFLFYLNGTVADTAFQRWRAMSPDPVSSFPPERFVFDVVKM